MEHANAQELIGTVWDSLGCMVKIPDEWTDYFERNGRKVVQHDDHRRFVRYYLTGRAILEVRGTYHSIYTKDLSRMGVAIMHHEQLLPRERVRIWLPSAISPWLEVRRCQRIQDNCYECGTVFLADKSEDGNAELKTMAAN